MATPEGNSVDLQAIVKDLVAKPAAVLKIGGDDVDLGKLGPLTIGDKRKLFKAAGVDIGRAARFTPEEEFQYALYLVRRVRPQTTEDELEAAELKSLVEISLQMIRVEGVMSARPTSASSPTSPGGTAGAPATSTS